MRTTLFSERPRTGRVGTVANPNFKLLAVIAANCIGLNAIIYFLLQWIQSHSWLPEWLIDSNAVLLRRLLTVKQGHDSWAPMHDALYFWQTHPGSLIYRQVFFLGHTKFQYPLSSLLAFLLLDKAGLTYHQICIALGIIDWTALCAVAVLCVAIARESRTPAGCPTARLDYPTIAAILLGSLLFYPLLKGCVIGQIQTLLTLAFTAAFYCWLRGKERTAGVLIGLMILCKPQFSLLLLWAALRRRWGAAISGLVCVAIVMPIALYVFGWQNNLDYLSVLQALSRVGEIYYPNHSMNGLLNRLLFNGADQSFHMDSFPPFHPVVYAGTLISSMVLVLTGLIFPGARDRRGDMADLAFMAAVATIASPIAWQHHYGVFLPILVWLWFGRASGRAPLRSPAWLLAAYVLISDCLSPLNLVYRVPVLNIIQSHVYLGGLIVLWILISPKYAPAGVMARQDSTSAFEDADAISVSTGAGVVIANSTGARVGSFAPIAIFKSLSVVHWPRRRPCH